MARVEQGVYRIVYGDYSDSWYVVYDGHEKAEVKKAGPMTKREAIAVAESLKQLQDRPW